MKKTTLSNLKYKNLTCNKLLHNLRFLFASSLLTFSLNVSSSDTQAFDKDAYLDLSKPYTYNWNNTPSYTKKDNQANKLLKQVGRTIGSAIGSTNSDNVSQLGNKITTGIKGQLKNQAINNVESLVNKKANKYANSFGKGKTEISIRKITSKKPDYSLRTIQPLTQLSDDSTEFAFVQAQLNSGENFGSRRSTLNLGVGYRQLLEQGQSIAGVNLFADYESKSKHKRGSIGLEYQRANFNLNVNKYFPISDKKVIVNHTEEALAGYDVKFLGRVPYLPWAKVKATRYVWNGVAKSDVKGTIFGIEVQLSDSVRMEFGSEDNNTVERKTYARFTTALPISDHESMTNFSIGKKAFQNSGIVNLGDLEFVERSNKIRIEKLLNGLPIVLGEYNAPTEGATCTLYNSSGVALGTASTGSNGQVNLVGVMNIPAGLVTMACGGGTYTDEATGVAGTAAPTVRAATIYSGTGPLTLLASPLSEIAYQLANTNTSAGAIDTQNTAVATAFGISGVDIVSTTPTDINTTAAANDDAGKFGTILAAVSQMGENSDDANPTATIKALVDDMAANGDIDGRNTGAQTVDVVTAINNFKNGTGDNNKTNGTGAGNTGSASDFIIAIITIDAYDSTNTAPTVQQYADAGVTGVSAGNLAQMNSRIALTASGNKDTTTEIQSVINTPVVTSFTVNTIADVTVAENVVFTGSTPAITGTPIGTLTYTLGGTDVANFSINSSTGVISMVARDFEFPADANKDNVYEVTIIVTDADANSASETQTVTVTDVFESVSITFNSLTYITIQSPDTGKVWLDRNLGATKVATSSTDTAAYGHLYQWGRNDDGHEDRTNASGSAILAPDITNAGTTLFITSTSDWVSSSVDDNGDLRTVAWANGGVNDICPAGFSVPTKAELVADTISATNTATAFSSFLKIPVAGYRSIVGGAPSSVGTSAILWSSSSVSGTNGSSLGFSSGDASFISNSRAFGFSVRCIKD